MPERRNSTRRSSARVRMSEMSSRANKIDPFFPENRGAGLPQSPIDRRRVILKLSWKPKSLGTATLHNLLGSICRLNHRNWAWTMSGPPSRLRGRRFSLSWRESSTASVTEIPRHRQLISPIWGRLTIPGWLVLASTCIRALYVMRYQMQNVSKNRFSFTFIAMRIRDVLPWICYSSLHQLPLKFEPNLFSMQLSPQHPIDIQ